MTGHHDQREREYQVGNPHHGGIRLTAEVARDRAPDGADRRGDNRHGERDFERALRSTQNPRELVLTHAVRTEPVDAVRRHADVNAPLREVEWIEQRSDEREQDEQHEYAETDHSSLVLHEALQDQLELAALLDRELAFRVVGFVRRQGRVVDRSSHGVTGLLRPLHG
jgi:hypothetical protein